MRFLRQSLTGLFLFAATAALVLLAVNMVYRSVETRLARENQPPQGRERMFSVNVITARPGTQTPELTAFGEVQSRRSLDIRAAIGGTVIHLAQAFEEGGRVTQGEVLLQIDPADANAALERIQNDVLDAEAEERDADRAVILAQDELTAARDQVALRDKALQRQTDLAARGIGTAAAVETAEFAVSAAQQSVLARRQALTQAKARIDQAATRLTRTAIALAEADRRMTDTTVTADYTGTLADVTIVQGGLVSANEKLARLIDPENLEVAFRVSTPQYVRLLDDTSRLRKADITVVLEVLGNDLVATGRISRDSAAVGEGQTGRLLFADLNSSPGFKPGDFVTVRVREAPLENVIRLPASAVDASNRVLVLGEGDRLESMAVTTLRRLRDDVLVRAPALEGREVVTRRTPLLGAGIRVTPLRPADDTAMQQPAEMLDLSAEHRARLIAFVQQNTRMPDDARERLLAELAQPRVAARTVRRLEARMGG
jgi:multidrug efflux pump subunit AcrA (membrane-fusion protein)